MCRIISQCHNIEQFLPFPAQKTLYTTEWIITNEWIHFFYCPMFFSIHALSNLITKITTMVWYNLYSQSHLNNGISFWWWCCVPMYFCRIHPLSAFFSHVFVCLCITFAESKFILFQQSLFIIHVHLNITLIHSTLLFPQEF